MTLDVYAAFPPTVQIFQHICQLDTGLRSKHQRILKRIVASEVAHIPARWVVRCTGAIRCISLFVLLSRHKIRVSGKMGGGGLESRDCGVIKTSESWGSSGG